MILTCFTTRQQGFASLNFQLEDVTGLPTFMFTFCFALAMAARRMRAIVESLAGLSSSFPIFNNNSNTNNNNWIS